MENKDRSEILVISEMTPEAAEPKRDVRSLKSKRGGVKGSMVAITVLSIALVLSLVFFAVGSLFVFFRYVRPASQVQSDTRQDIVATIPTETLPPETNTPNPTVPSQTVQTPVTGEELSTEEINERVGPATVSILAQVSVDSFFGVQTGDSSGSGFIISEDGYIVTNNHVIVTQGNQSSSNIRVRIPGFTEEIPAKVVGRDPNTDIAVLKVEKTGLPYVVLGNSSELRVGERAVAIGNPLGSFEGTVTQGVISALERPLLIENQEYNLLQTDASINSGNSGGPLLNSRGQVIGVTNAKISSAEGIGFAIPIDDVKPVIKDLMEKGYVTGRPVIGILTDDVTEEISRRYGLPVGVFVAEVNPGSPAEIAGIKARDIIIAIDGETVTTNSDIVSIRDEHAVGDELVFTVMRNDEELEVPLILGENVMAE